MASKFQVTVGEDTYTLEFTRSAFIKMESEGFDMLDLRAKPLSSSYTLFWGALLKHHPDIDFEESKKLFDTMLDDEGYDFDNLLGSLMEMMNEVFTSSLPKNKRKTVKLMKGMPQ